MPSLRSRLIQSIIRDVKDSFLSDVPLELRRSRADEVASRGIRIPRGVSTREVIAGGVPAVWLEPEDSVPGRTLLYLHGGGYVLGSILTHKGLAGRIAHAAKAKALLIEYRLAPEHPFPAALEDASRAYSLLLEQGVDPRHLAIGGDSAGGGLAVSTALHLKDQDIPLPAALFLISPWTDLTFSGESVVTRKERDPILSLDSEWLESVYAGDYPLDHPLVSPLFADHQGLPPTLLQVGSEEILYDDSSRLAAKLDAAGVKTQFETWDEMWHVFQAYAPYVPEAQKAIDRIGEFLNVHLGDE